MAKIEAFRSIRYNPDQVSDLSLVVAPPYDVIDTGGQEALYQKHPYNFVRLILGRELTADTPAENRYTRAAGYFEEWQRRGILVRDDKPAIYVIEQKFSVGGRPLRRLGFIALMRLDDEGQKTTVHPHEHTHAAPKEDRLRLMREVEANLSPIFTVFSDPRKTARRLLEAVTKEEPCAAARDDGGVDNRMWRLTDPVALGKLKKHFAGLEVFIADGHHRHEVARLFREEKRRSAGPAFKDAYNYIMTYFTALEDDGICILPTHRLIENAAFDLEALRPAFEISKAASLEELLAAMAGEKEGAAFGVYREKTFSLLRLVDRKLPRQLLPEASDVYRALDVALLHVVAFDHFLKIPLSSIRYEIQADRAVEAVDAGRFGALFLLNPTRIEQIRAVALAGGAMPQKSTYFYPKVLSGLAVHKF
ncbi:MAG: DUF1015 domain-containing protein [Deltaproteobacteria bacterium]